MSNKQRDEMPRSERGTIIVMTAILMLGLFLAMGLAIDVSRVYAVRAELQNAADAAALTAARELNGGIGGINDAVTRANAIANNYGFTRTPITVASVEFATALNGTYVNQATAAGNAANIKFVRVTTEAVDVNMLFAVTAFVDGTHAESRNAVAGESVGINGICDFFPIAVALTNPNPAANTTMTLNFTQGSGSSATLANQDYIILEVPDINGNGAPETAVLSAGLTSICASMGANIEFKMTPSANLNNGPRQITDGVNTRFNVYANGYGNALQPATFPPDSNVRENISYADYKDRTSVTAPSPNAPGEDDRRILIAPIVLPGTYNPPRTQIVNWGAFFMKKRSTVSNPCNQASAACGDIEVEWVDEGVMIGRGYYDPTGGSSSLTLPVLYK
ncbi:MAG TPA: pilus assembly protein TadG-related protein [Pyrinomonadaceae bacterium]